MKNGNAYLAEAESERMRRNEKKIREEKKRFFSLWFPPFQIPATFIVRFKFELEYEKVMNMVNIFLTFYV